MKKVTFTCMWIAIASISISQLITTKRLNEQSHIIKQYMMKESEYLEKEKEYQEKLHKILEAYPRIENTRKDEELWKE